MEQVLAEHACWFEEMVRAREEEEEERRQKVLTLKDKARQLLVNAVIPDVTDPLESCDPNSHLDHNFPMSREEFRATWRIGFFQEWAYDNDNYVLDSE